MSRVSVVAAFAWATLAPGMARADAPAQLRPTRDVDVTYKAPVPHSTNTALLQRLRFSAKLQHQRLDMPTSSTWILFDIPGHRMMLVNDAARKVNILLADGELGQVNLAAGSHWERRAGAKIAGLACTDWQVMTKTGPGPVSCYTDDGVVLRIVDGARLVMEAASVGYASQPEAAMVVPAGYQMGQPGGIKF